MIEENDFVVVQTKGMEEKEEEWTIRFPSILRYWSDSYIEIDELTVWFYQ